MKGSEIKKPINEIKKYFIFTPPNQRTINPLKAIKIDDINFEKRVSVMKIDVQGYDLDALKGSKKTILKHKMPIIFEYEEKFEKEFAKYHKRKYCLMTPSCTMAIYLSLKSLKLKKGDEVIVPDVTWTASVSPVVEVGAKPIFVDIESSNWCINPEKIINKINNGVRF